MFTPARQKLLVRVVAFVVMAIYTILTVFPFYALFVRSFVATKVSTTLWLWIPPGEELHMNQEVGNLAVFYDLDLRDFKEAMGIPPETFLMSRTPLYKIAEDFGISEERMQQYFAGYYTYNGWITMLRHSDFWGTLGRSVLIVGASLAGLTVLSIFTGYGLAGLRRRDQMFIYNLYLLQMVIPAMLIILPQFLLIQGLLKLFPGHADPGTSRYPLQRRSGRCQEGGNGGAGGSLEVQADGLRAGNRLFDPGMGGRGILDQNSRAGRRRPGGTVLRAQILDPIRSGCPA